MVYGNGSPEARARPSTQKRAVGGGGGGGVLLVPDTILFVVFAGKFKLRVVHLCNHIVRSLTSCGPTERHTAQSLRVPGHALRRQRALPSTCLQLPEMSLVSLRRTGDRSPSRLSCKSQLSWAVTMPACVRSSLASSALPCRAATPLHLAAREITKSQCRPWRRKASAHFCNAWPRWGHHTLISNCAWGGNHLQSRYSGFWCPDALSPFFSPPPPPPGTSLSITSRAIVWGHAAHCLAFSVYTL